MQVPEGRQLFTDMTVLENLQMGAFNKGTKAHFQENLKKAYGWFPKLEERAKQAAGTLSGGEQQMVAVARALIDRSFLHGNPTVFVVAELYNHGVIGHIDNHTVKAAGCQYGIPYCNAVQQLLLSLLLLLLRADRSQSGRV